MSTVDKNIRKIIKICMKERQRSVFALFGGEVADKVTIIHQLLRKGRLKRFPILICSKSSSGKSQQHINSLLAPCASDSEEDTDGRDSALLIHKTYKEFNSITESSFRLVILQDIESSNLSILASVAEKVVGGGAVLFLFSHQKHFENIVDKKASIDGSSVSRSFLRFIAFLKTCPNHLILNEDGSTTFSLKKYSEPFTELASHSTHIQLSEQHKNHPIIGSLIKLCLTRDQAELVANCHETLKKRTFHAVVTASSPKGRGKSAALGLTIAGGIALNYSNIFISSSSYDNVKILFQFLLKGLDVLGYKEDTDYDLIESVNPKFKKALIGIDIFRDHPQSVRFIFPNDIGEKLEQAELVVIDEAASIPTPTLKKVFGPYIVLMASSISGYGSTSSYVYDEMIQTIRPLSSSASATGAIQKLTLQAPIHYVSDDKLELWTNDLLCLNSSVSSYLTSGFPEPQQCKLYYVSRDVLFSGNAQVETFLKSMVSVLNSSSRCVHSDFIFEIADSSNLDVFCLLPPVCDSELSAKEILCVVLVHAEEVLPQHIVHSGSNLKDIPMCFNLWKQTNEIAEPNFNSLSGVHILNIVTHPSYRKMGYGSRVLEVLRDFYEGKCVSLIERGESNQSPRLSSTTPLLLDVSDIQPEAADYFLVSYSLNSEKLRFWRKTGFIPVFISKQKNSEGDHSFFMLKGISETFSTLLEKYWSHYQKHYCTLLNSECKNFPSSLGLSLLCSKSENSKNIKVTLSKEEIDSTIRPHRMKCLERYCQNLQDFHSVINTVPMLTQMYFRKLYKDLHLPRAQEAILMSYGLQYKTVEEISADLGLPAVQIHGLLNRSIRKLTKYLTDIIEKSVENTFAKPDVEMNPVMQDLNEELEEAAKKIREQQEKETKKLLDLDLSQYAIRGSEDDWQKALLSGRKTLVSIKSIKPPSEISEDTILKQSLKKPKQKQMKRKR